MIRYNAEFRVMVAGPAEEPEYHLLQLKELDTPEGEIPEVELVHVLTSKDIASVIAKIREAHTRAVTHVDFTF